MKKLSFVLLVAFAIVFFKGNNWVSKIQCHSFSKHEVLMERLPMALKTCSKSPLIITNLSTTQVAYGLIAKNSNSYGSKICPHCGHKNKPSSSSCRMCGRPLNV